MLCDYISHCGNVSEMQLRLYPKNLIQCTNTTNKKKKLPSKTYCHKQNPGYYTNNKFKMITHSLLIISSKICNSMDVESKY